MIKLYLITDNFPFGKGEKSFIMPELNFLIRKFDVTIISSSECDSQTTKLSKNIKVLKYNKSKNVTLFIKYFVKSLLNKSMLLEIKEIITDGRYIFSRLRRAIIFYMKSEDFHQYLVDENILNSTDSSIFYSYWCNHKLFGISNHRSKYPYISLITRVHGYDLYNERMTNGRLPFRNSIDNYVDRIIFASNFGREYYLKTHNKNLSDKYHLSKLGVENNFTVAPYQDNSTLVLVSCSNVIPLKRIGLIIEALALIDEINIEWIHFGDGESFDKIKFKALEFLSNKDNINYIFKGHVDYLDIHKFYQEENVSCFITTSSTEGGAPVSIQEALSYGIPIIGTSVGGITEMINGNGLLLDQNPSPSSIADAIRKISNMCYEDYILLRERSRLIWEEEYNAESNCKEFAEYLLTIHNN